MELIKDGNYEEFKKLIEINNFEEDELINEKKVMNENTGTHSRNMHSSLLSPNILLL